MNYISTINSSNATTTTTASNNVNTTSMMRCKRKDMPHKPKTRSSRGFPPCQCDARSPPEHVQSSRFSGDGRGGGVEDLEVAGIGPIGRCYLGLGLGVWGLVFRDEIVVHSV
jgi:hypothetical protein